MNLSQLILFSICLLYSLQSIAAQDASTEEETREAEMFDDLYSDPKGTNVNLREKDMFDSPDSNEEREENMFGESQENNDQTPLEAGGSFSRIHQSIAEKDESTQLGGLLLQQFDSHAG